MENRRVALVTGGNRGIGLEVCRQLAQAGLQVVLTARDIQQGQAAQQALRQQGLDVDFQSLDITEPETLKSMVATLSQTYGRLDLLINNAGILPDEDGSALTVSPQTVRDVFETNTLGPLQVTQQLLPLLRKGKTAKVINVSSGMGSLQDMDGGYAAYRISKAALNAVTRLLAIELQRDRIAVNAVCPGWVRTDMGGPQADRSVAEGAAGIVKLALQEPTPTNQFLRDLEPIAW